MRVSIVKDLAAVALFILTFSAHAAPGTIKWTVALCSGGLCVQTVSHPAIGLDGNVFVSNHLMSQSGLDFGSITSNTPSQFRDPNATDAVSPTGRIYHPSYQSVGVLNGDGSPYCAEFCAGFGDGRMTPSTTSDGKAWITIQGNYQNWDATGTIQNDGSCTLAKMTGQIPNNGLPHGTIEQAWATTLLDICGIDITVGRDGTLYLPVRSGNLIVAMMSPGAEKWRYDTGGRTGPVALDHEDTAYAVSETSINGTNNYLRAITSAGVLKWQVLLTNASWMGNPLIGSDGTIYVTEGGPLYAVGFDGTVKWSYPTNSCRGVLGANNAIYCVTSSTVYAISSTGTLLWSTSLGVNLSNVTYPVLAADGSLIFSGYNSTSASVVAYSIETASGGIAGSPWPKWRHDNQNSAVASGTGVPSLIKNKDLGNPCDKPGCEATGTSTNFNSSVSFGAAINPVNGNTYERTSDYDGLTNGLDVTRRYNSLLATDAGLGVGWSMGLLGRRIEISGNTAIVHQSSGRAEPFTCPTTGSCTGDADTTASLSKDSGGFSINYRDGSSERYDTTGRLLLSNDQRGAVTSFNYGGSSVIPSFVTGPFGHVVTFGLSGSHLGTLTFPGGAVYTFSYDVNGNLTQVSYPDGRATIYHYENASLKNALTGLSYKETNGTITRNRTYGYSSNGKATSLEYAGAQAHVQLNYVSAGLVDVVDAAGTTQHLNTAENLNSTFVRGGVNQSDGKGSSFAYDANNNLTCERDLEGHVTRYQYSSTNQMNSMTEGLSGDCVTPFTTPVTRITTYQYRTTNSAQMTQIRRPSVSPGLFYTTTLTYADAAHPNLPTTLALSGFTPTGSPIARSITLSYNSLGKLATIDGPRTDVSDITTFAYNICTTGSGCGQLSSVTNALGHKTTFDAYDGDGHVTQTTDANGMKTVYQRDVRGQVIQVTETPSAGGGSVRVTNYTFNAAGNLATAQFPDGVTLTYTYDGAQLLKQVVDNIGNKLVYSYDNKGNRTFEELRDSAGTLARQINSDYDIRDRAAHVNNGGAQVLRLNDALGNLSRLTDANQFAANSGIYTSLSYDALNRLTDTTDNNNGVTHISYDVGGHVTTVQTPNNSITQYKFDDFGQLLSEQSPDRGTITKTYDSASNILTETDARPVTVSFTYDAIGRRLTANYPGTADDMTYTYDSATSPTCARGKGRLCRVQDASGTVTYNYDSYGNVTTQTKVESGVTYVTSYTYDAADRIASITYPDGRSVVYTRDARGRVANAAVTVNGVSKTIISNRSYDAAGRVLTQSYGNSVAESRQYDLQGNLIDQSVGNIDHRVYFFDLNGNLTTKQSSPESATYNYDYLNRLTRDTHGAAPIETYSYDGNSNRLSDSLGNYSYLFGSNRLTSTPRGINSIDIAGNTQTTDSAVALTYNGAGQVQQATKSGVVSTYVYNFDGLRTRKQVGTVTAIYHYDTAGQLLIETTSTGQPLRSYVYIDGVPVAQIEKETPPPLSIDIIVDNAQAAYVGTWPTATAIAGFYGTNYQTHTAGTGSNAATFRPTITTAGTYQILARWVAATTNASNAKYLVTHTGGTTTVTQSQRVSNGQWVSLGNFSLAAGTTGKVVLNDQANGRVIADAVRFVATIAQPAVEVVRYLHTDDIDTPRLATSATGSKIWSWEGSAFGTTSPNQDPDADGRATVVNLRFPGQYADTETGLFYNGARYYSPVIGRYVSSDPIGINGGSNTYAYVGGNPGSVTDPSGLDWIEYTGERATYYGGDPGDRTKSLQQCSASSGFADKLKDYRFPAFATTAPDRGPVPPGHYAINLVPDPYRIAPATALGWDLGALQETDVGGIERVPTRGILLRSGRIEHFGAWGTWRARLQPKAGTNTNKRKDMYLHNSSKGYTHGCVETCDEMRHLMMTYRKDGAQSIEVWINYTDKTTNGGAKH